MSSTEPQETVMRREDEILVERLHETMPNSPSFVESCKTFLEEHPVSSTAAKKLTRELLKTMPLSESFTREVEEVYDKLHHPPVTSGERPMSSEAARQFTDEVQERILVLTPMMIREMQDIYDRRSPNLSGGECLYAFFGHLCNLPDPIVLSKKHNPVRIHDLIDKFCKLNNIPDPEPGWEKRLNPLFYKETMKMDGTCIMHSQPLSLCPQCRDNAVQQGLMNKNNTIKDLRDTLIEISVEDCNCVTDPQGEGATYQCPRCRALEVLEETKAG